MEPRRVAPLLGLGALLVADAALIAWAFRPAPAEVAQAATSAGALSSPNSSSGSATPTDGPSPTSSESPSPVDLPIVPLTRVAGAAPDGVAWVADAGTCRRPGTVWVTSDGGASWSREDAPGRVLRVRPATSAAGFVTGGDTDCALRLWSTEDAGASWTGPDTAQTAWSRVPDEPRAVDTPSGEEVRPCGSKRDVLDLAPLDASVALALCEDGQVRTTQDGGGSWDAVFEVEGAWALALAPDGSAAVVARAVEGCAGIDVVPVLNSTPSDTGTCVESSPRKGKVAVAASGSLWWLVVGDEVFTAPEPDADWKAAAGGLESP